MTYPHRKDQLTLGPVLTYPTTLAELVRWALDQNVRFEEVKISARSVPYEAEGAEGEISYAPEAYAYIDKKDR